MGYPIHDILSERIRQISEEGWTDEHDDVHADGELAIAAAHYASFSALRPDLRSEATNEDSVRFGWPFDVSWWKPTDRRRDLVKAGALIVAEIERLDRAAHARGES